MRCGNCGDKIPDNEIFCGKCGKKITTKNTAKGDASINIAGSNRIKNSNLYVENIYHSEKMDDIAYINREYIKPIEIAGNPVKTSWLIISGIVGFIGSLASIYSVIGSSWTILFAFTLLISAFLLLNGVLLLKRRFSRLIQFNLESNKHGEVFLTKISGTCPKCKGVLKLVEEKISHDKSKTFVCCARNNDHKWIFDFTVLDEL